MSAAKKPSVLVCVTGQYDCDRLIESGSELAVKHGYDLRVLCVHTPDSNPAYISDEIEYLYRTAKNLGAEMTIAFNDRAPKYAADFARKVNARYLITGLPDRRPNGFVLTLHELLPRLRITMVTKEGESLIYSPVAADRALA